MFESPARRAASGDHLFRRHQRAVKLRAGCTCTTRRRTRWPARAGHGRVADGRGAPRTPHRPHLESRTTRLSRPCFGQQRESRAGFGGNTAFLSRRPACPAPLQWTCDRSEFFDATGRLVSPATLGHSATSGADPCAALAGDFSAGTGPGPRRSTFMLGHAADAARRRAAGARWRRRDSAQALDEVKAAGPACSASCRCARPTRCSTPWSTAGCCTRPWRPACGPRPAFTRPAAPSAFATSCRTPWRLRSSSPAPPAPAHPAQRLRASSPKATCSTGGTRPAAKACARIFPTTCCGCPMRCAWYVAVTGDGAILDEEVAFIDGPAIPEGAEDAYCAPQTSAQIAPPCSNTARAPSTRASATGAHGLPLMGTGDWNDGMNRVGHEGRGESVWLGWFLRRVVQDFEPAGRSARGDRARRQLAGRAPGLDQRPAQGRLGRRLVPPRLLRQRRAAGLRRQQRMPHRPDRARPGPCCPAPSTRRIHGPGHARP